jgi:hypothetical protein
MKFSDFNLLDLGNSIGVTGVLFSDNNKSYAWVLPDQDVHNIEIVPMTIEEWKKGLLQVDVQEVEIFTKGPNGEFIKSVVRKTQRIIEQRVSWAVYKRDNYTCRYCGRDGIPMTVDHLVLWEKQGPSVEANLLTSCRKDNKTRGNMEYADWLKSPYYLKVSQNLSPVIRRANEILVETLSNIPLRQSERTSR